MLLRCFYSATLQLEKFSEWKGEGEWKWISFVSSFLHHTSGRTGIRILNRLKRTMSQPPLSSLIPRLTAMTSFLISDVRMHNGYCLITQCLGPKAILPLEMLRYQIVFIDKIRRASFYLLHNCSQRNIWIQQKQCMHMILHSIDHTNWASHFLKLLSHVLMDVTFNFTLNKKRPVLGGPSRVDPYANIRVGHSKKCLSQNYFEEILKPKIDAYKLWVSQATAIRIITWASRTLHPRRLQSTAHLFSVG